MCLSFQIKYQLCNHTSDVHEYPCSSPIDHVDSELQILIYQLPDLPDFCPNCMLNTLIVWCNTQPARNMVTHGPRFRSYRQLGPGYAALAAKMWERVEYDLNHNEDLDLFFTEIDPEGLPNVVDLCINDIWSMMACFFWIDVVDKGNLPTQWRPKFLIQVQNYQIAHIMHNEVRERLLQQTTEFQRSPALSSLLTRVTEPLEEDELLCVICNDALGEANSEGVTEAPVKTPCDHLFGQKCLETWIQNRNEGCPLCRAVIVPEEQQAADSERQEAVRQQQQVARQQQDIARQQKLPPKWVVYILSMNPNHVRRDWSMVVANGPHIFLRVDVPTWDTSSDEDERENRRSYMQNGGLPLMHVARPSSSSSFWEVVDFDEDAQWIDDLFDSDDDDDDEDDFYFF